MSTALEREPYSEIVGRTERNEERRAKAFELRKAGAGYRRIGRELGVSHDTAHKDVRKVLRRLIARTQESAEEARRLDLERLDAMLLALAPQIRDGRIGAITNGVKILERRAKMLGYDAPQQVQMAAVVAEVDTAEAARLRVREKLLRLFGGDGAGAQMPVLDITPVAPKLGEAGGNGHGHSPAGASTG